MDKRILHHTLSLRAEGESQPLPDGHVVLFGRAARNRLPGLEGLVDVWVETLTPPRWPEEAPATPMSEVQVYGTGKPIDPEHLWIASFIDEHVGGVWHLYRVSPV